MSKCRSSLLLTRREFLSRGSMCAGALCVPAFLRSERSKEQQLLNSAALEKFVDPLPIPQVARPAGVRANPGNPRIKLPYYRMSLREFEVKLHRDVPPTRVWRVNGSFPGQTLNLRRNQPVLVEWANELPHRHLLPIDHTVHGAGTSVPDVRTVIHLHGGRVPPESDGYPEAWYAPGKSAVYFYPNQQDAAMLWYHDHALGITRLNVYAGLFGACFLRDEVEDALPLPRGKYEIPLLVSDRSLTHEGQLAYPAKWESEVEGDVILVNGKVFPFLEVEPRLYRFRVLNAANTHAFDFALSNQQKFYQIGTDLGLLPAPVELQSLYLAPGERADLMVDFSPDSGANIVLMDDKAAVMQFRVARTSSQTNGSELPKTLRPVARILESQAVKSRMLTLQDVIVNSDEPVAMLLDNKRWHDPVTEKPVLNSVEIWNLINLVDEMHPIHLHLAHFQVLDRRRFDVLGYQENRVLNFSGPPLPPDANEMGWKDTVQARQGMVTRIIARFAGYTGRYVWHCHILEHEDNEMMRPFVVVPP